MINMYLFAATFLCGMDYFVSAAPVSTGCQVPIDLNIHYERLLAETFGNKFLLPAEYNGSPVNITSNRGETTCPSSLPNGGKMQDRSTCPWYTTVTTNDIYFPSIRSRAVCRCSQCIGSNGMHVCEPVYSEAMFLKRTNVCVDGLYVYEPVTEHIPTACVCARKKTDQIPSDGGSDF